MIVQNLDMSKPLFCDTETKQLYSKMWLFQMYQEHWEEPLLLRGEDIIKAYEEVKDCHTVWHNYSYDGAVFCNDLDVAENPFKNFDDTLLLARLVFYDKLDSFSLDSCLEYVCGFDIYEGLDKKALQKSFVSSRMKEISEEQLRYASLDVLYLPKLYHAVESARDEWVYRLSKSFINQALRWQQFGFPVDKTRLEKQKADTLKELESIKLPGSLNVNSPKQCKEALGSESSDRETLLILQRSGNELAENILKKRRLMKRLNFLSRYSFDRVRGYFSPTAISGRVRCSGSGESDGTDNLLQIPRDLKEVFGCGESGGYLVYADFAQLELRTLAVDTGDESMIHLFKSGKDLHTHSAAKIFNKPESEVTKADRLVGKVCNFSLLYLAGCSAFRQVLELNAPPGFQVPSFDESTKIVSTWRRIYPGVKVWHDSVLRQFRKGSMVGETLNGRKYKAKIFTDLAGIRNQGLGAEVALLSLHYLLKDRPDVRVLVFIHDAFVLEAENLDEARVLAKLLAHSMVKGWWGAIKNAKGKLSMPVSVFVGKNWGDIERGKFDYEYSLAGAESDI